MKVVAAEQRKNVSGAWLRKGGRGGTYARQARSLAREMVSAGCARTKVGKIMQLVAATFGIRIQAISRCTVGRMVLEGGVAAKLQSAYEILKTDGLTISQDSTSHRKQNIESHHFHPKVPDYEVLAEPRREGIEVESSVLPRIRLLCVTKLNDHSSKGSIDEWKEAIAELVELYNRSPLAKRLNQRFEVRDFLRVLKGMCGDHANNEKATADGIKEWKHEEAIKELGEDTLKEKTLAELILYLASWNLKKIESVGVMEQAEKDAALMEEIVHDLGQEAYDNLSTDKRRKLDLFVWSGCCMHKDQNSFKGGNAEMMKEWEKLGVDPPVLLANKTNSAILYNVFDPAGNLDKLDENQRRAFEESTRGGVKAMNLASALFNNKDDKKGQGDTHVNLFGHRFPDTNNTRFGSHADATAEVVKHLDAYVDYVRNGIPYSKTNVTHTNIEINLRNALEDKVTLTELCAMVIYANAEWEDTEAMEMVFKLAPTLPHLKPITLAFFRGALATWIRFSVEFAPGGLIDETSKEERLLAWMPPTNDPNESALGRYRVTMRDKSTLSLHQYNAEAMYSRNKTLSFMSALFEDEDHTFVMQEARQIDSSGLEAKRKAAQLEFRCRVIQMNQEKEEAKRKRAAQLREKLMGIPLIRDLSELENTPRAELNPKGSLEEKRLALITAFKTYLEKLADLKRPFGSSLGSEDIVPQDLPVQVEWHDEEDAEMEE
ncbi:hypothetical protein K435DRAFT_821621 [Dendrothele bispora CBS 962.96]|uniref:Uncharacterized protein n=1 Tax=Dendrothele bispora (strain CBS 962.96) TaxID=1314807 RepID=A0A4S8LI78_DENBC|nr:hypothetical protein K435DRAFT_821621 [Dendrothele bispora CBS 962.96]